MEGKIGADFEAKMFGLEDELSAQAKVYLWIRYGIVYFKVGDVWLIVFSQFRFLFNGGELMEKKFVSKNVLAVLGWVKLEGQSVSEVIRSVVEFPWVSVDGFHIGGLLAGERQISGYFVANDRRLSNEQRVVSSFRVSGDKLPEYIKSAELDLELKSSVAPYDNLNELLVDFEIDVAVGDSASLVFVFPNVCEVANESSVDSGSLNLQLLCGEGIEIELLRVGVRMFPKSGKGQSRSVLDCNGFDWQSSVGLKLGRIKIDGFDIGRVCCYISYAGRLQHWWWLMDLRHIPNAGFVAMMIYDNGLLELRKNLMPRSVGDKAREFESAVAAVLWMLGFRVFQFVGTRETPDILAQTDSGNLLVVECTTGSLISNGKVEKLMRRHQEIISGFQEAEVHYSKVLPVMVTQLKRSIIESEIVDVEKRGVYVVTSDEFDSLLERVRFLTTGSDLVFKGVFDSIRSKDSSVLK